MKGSVGVVERRPVSLVLAGLVLTATLVGCGHAATTVAEPSAAVSAAGQTMSGAELAALWDNPDSEPCDQPGPILGDALQAVADSMKDFPTIQTVKSRLITVTARDTQGASASDVLTVTTIAPSASITTPTAAGSYLTTSRLVTLAGTASDDYRISSVTWANDRGGSGTCSGTTNWSMPNISLVPGRNTITVTAHDGSGYTGTAVIVVYYVTRAPTTIAAAKQSTNGADVYLTDQPVSAIFGSCFYIEQSNRASAIRVVLPSLDALQSVGSLVDVGGTIKTGADGERYIEGVAKTKD